MSKIEINPIAGAASFTQLVQAINVRLQQLEDTFNDSVLWRDNIGTNPNEMNADLDMNGFAILNCSNLVGSGGGTFDGYTKAELNAGQLDTRYYTEAEIISLLGDFQVYVDTADSALAQALADLETTSLGDVSNITPSTGQALVWSGTEYVPTTVGSPGIVMLRKPSSQAANGATLALTADYDPNGDWDSINNRFVAPAAGRYIISGFIDVSAGVHINRAPLTISTLSGSGGMNVWTDQMTQGTGPRTRVTNSFSISVSLAQGGFVQFSVLASDDSSFTIGSANTLADSQIQIQGPF